MCVPWGLIASFDVFCTLELFHTFRRFPTLSTSKLVSQFQSFIWIFRATASCWNATKLAWHGHSVLPKVKATAHHRATHTSHISTHCENFHSRNPVLTFNFTTTLCNPSKYNNNSLIVPNSNLPAGLGYPGSPGSPTSKPYGILATEELWDLLHWQLFRIHLQVLTEPQFSGFILGNG